MTKDVGKLYIGNKVMMDISKCEQELEEIKEKIKRFMEENQKPIE